MSTTNSTCLHVVAGNTFDVAVQLTQIAWGDGTGTTTDFVPEDDDTIRVSLICRGRAYRCLDISIDDNTLSFTVKGNIAIGMYDLEILILRSDGTKLRSLQEDAIEIVYSNSEAGIPDTDELQQTSFTINSAVFMLVSGVELDWDDTPTEDSDSVVTSGGIYTAIEDAKTEMYITADEEDITETEVDEIRVLKFKDREPVYDDDGELLSKGYVILRTTDTLANQLTQEDTIYEVRYDFDLEDEEVTIPDGCVLKFNGGKIENGIVTSDYTFQVIDESGARTIYPYDSYKGEAPAKDYSGYDFICKSNEELYAAIETVAGMSGDVKILLKDNIFHADSSFNDEYSKGLVFSGTCNLTIEGDNAILSAHPNKLHEPTSSDDDYNYYNVSSIIGSRKGYSVEVVDDDLNYEPFNYIPMSLVTFPSVYDATELIAKIRIPEDLRDIITSDMDFSDSYLRFNSTWYDTKVRIIDIDSDYIYFRTAYAAEDKEDQFIFRFKNGEYSYPKVRLYNTDVIDGTCLVDGVLRIRKGLNPTIVTSERIASFEGFGNVNFYHLDIKCAAPYQNGVLGNYLNMPALKFIDCDAVSFSHCKVDSVLSYLVNGSWSDNADYSTGYTFEHCDIHLLHTIGNIYSTIGATFKHNLIYGDAMNFQTYSFVQVQSPICVEDNVFKNFGYNGFTAVTSSAGESVLLSGNISRNEFYCTDDFITDKDSFLLNDGGACYVINTLGETVTINDNVFHSIGQMQGIYLDNNCSNMVVSGNLFYDVTTNNINMNGANRYNVIEKNLLCGPSRIQEGTNYVGSSSFTNNIMFGEEFTKRVHNELVGVLQTFMSTYSGNIYLKSKMVSGRPYIYIPNSDISRKIDGVFTIIRELSSFVLNFIYIDQATTHVQRNLYERKPFVEIKSSTLLSVAADNRCWFVRIETLAPMIFSFDVLFGAYARCHVYMNIASASNVTCSVFDTSFEGRNHIDFAQYKIVTRTDSKQSPYCVDIYFGHTYSTITAIPQFTNVCVQSTSVDVIKNSIFLHTAPSNNIFARSTVLNYTGIENAFVEEGVKLAYFTPSKRRDIDTVDDGWAYFDTEFGEVLYAQYSLPTYKVEFPAIDGTVEAQRLRIQPAIDASGKYDSNPIDIDEGDTIAQIITKFVNILNQKSTYYEIVSQGDDYVVFSSKISCVTDCLYTNNEYGSNTTIFEGTAYEPTISIVSYYRKRYLDVNGNAKLFDVAYKLNNSTSSNTQYLIQNEDGYTTTLTADDGYTIDSVTILMGGEVLTDGTHYTYDSSTGVVTIPQKSEDDTGVIGELVIRTLSAEEEVEDVE